MQTMINKTGCIQDNKVLYMQGVFKVTEKNHLGTKAESYSYHKMCSMKDETRIFCLTSSRNIECYCEYGMS